MDQCRACGAEMKNIENNTFSFGNVPLAGNFCKTKEKAISAAKYPLTLISCEVCETVQVLHDVSDKILFSEYNYSSSSIGGLNRHFISYADFLANLYKDKTEISFLEIGCNDGILLKKLPVHWRKTGVDPSDVAKEFADKNYELFNEPFSKSLVDGKGLLESYDVISGSNCLAHISDIKNVFEGVWMALKPGGEFFIEVHNLYATIEGNQWETIYHEHKIEWDLESLCNVLLPLGFEFTDVAYLPLHGGLIRARFKKGNKDKGRIPVKNPRKKELLQQLHKAYLNRYDSDVMRLLQKQNKEKIIAYGAAGRAVMFLNHMSDLNFNTIIDDSPIRIGKFIPSIATKITDIETLKNGEFDFCLVTAWNYFDDIIEKNNFFKGKWLKYF